jgi:hypothetical protein
MKEGKDKENENHERDVNIFSSYNVKIFILIFDNLIFNCKGMIIIKTKYSQIHKNKNKKPHKRCIFINIVEKGISSLYIISLGIHSSILFYQFWLF